MYAKAEARGRSNQECEVERRPMLDLLTSSEAYGGTPPMDVSGESFVAYPGGERITQKKLKENQKQSKEMIIPKENGTCLRISRWLLDAVVEDNI
jgi:hypothetical protein